MFDVFMVVVVACRITPLSLANSLWREVFLPLSEGERSYYIRACRRVK